MAGAGRGKSETKKRGILEENSQERMLVEKKCRGWLSCVRGGCKGEDRGGFYRGNNHYNGPM